MFKKILTICLIFIGGCTWFADKREVIKAKPMMDPNSPEFREILSLVIKNKYDFGMLRKLTADKALQEYYLFSKPNEEVTKK